MYLFLILVISVSGITEVQSQDFGSGVASFGKLGIIQSVSNGFGGGHGRYLQDQTEGMIKTYAKEFPAITCVYLFINAFLMAAMVEELAKYFGFRMIEHPDFLSDEQLQEGAEAVEAALENKESEYEDDGSEDAKPDRGCVPYEAMGDTVATTVDAAVSTAAEAVGATSPRAESNLKLVPAPNKTCNGKAAAITVAMISVALGFACCENLVYIFIFAPSSDLETKISVLVLRSLFPIHPLLAAIQSIGVCRRDIENDRSFGVGRSILPAILLHGSFDLVIMIASFLVAVNPDDEKFEEAETASLVVSFAIVLFGAAYYVVQSRAQRKRLNEMESGAKAGLLPTATAAADHALV